MGTSRRGFVAGLLASVGTAAIKAEVPVPEATLKEILADPNLFHFTAPAKADIWLNGIKQKLVMDCVGSAHPSQQVFGAIRMVCTDAHGDMRFLGNEIVTKWKTGNVRWEQA